MSEASDIAVGQLWCCDMDDSLWVVASLSGDPAHGGRVELEPLVRPVPNVFRSVDALRSNYEHMPLEEEPGEICNDCNDHEPN